MTRLRKTLLIPTLLFGLLFAAGLIWREVVVETAIKLVLSSRGLDDARFEVVAVGQNEIVIENVSLDTGLLSAQRMRLTYDPTNLVSGRLRALRIEGFRFDARDTQNETLERLEELAFSGGKSWIVLPRIQLEKAEFLLDAPTDGAIVVDGELDLSGEGPGTTLEISVDFGTTTAAFTIQSDNLGEGGVIDIHGDGLSELVGMPVPGQTGDTMTGGHARFTVDGTVQIPALEASQTKSWLAMVLSLKGDLHLSEVTASIGPTALSSNIGWELHSNNAGLQIALTRPAKLVVRKISPEILAALHIPAVDGVTQELSIELSSSGPAIVWSPEDDGGRAEFTSDITVKLGEAVAEIHATATANYDATWHLSAPAKAKLQVSATSIAFSGAEGALLLKQASWAAAGLLTPGGTVDLNGSLAAEARDISLAGFKADAAAVNGEIRIRRDLNHWSLSATPGLLVAMGGAVVPNRLEIADSALLTMDKLELLSSDTIVRLEVSASSNQMSGVLLIGEDQDVTFADAGGRIILFLAQKKQTEGKIQFEDVQFMLPGEAISLSDVSGIMPLGANGSAEEVALSGRARDSNRAVRFPPVKFDLVGKRDGEIVSVSGSLETMDQSVRLPIESSVDLAELTGKINVVPTQLTFRKGGLQPGALIPNLTMLGNVRGAVRISAALNFDADGAMHTGMSLAFEDISARMRDVEVEGMSGTVQFNRLSPLATAGPQQLTARRLIAGVPVNRPRVRFTILPRRRGISVRLHEVAGEIAGGEIAVEDARWDSAAQTNAFDVQVRNIAIDQLLRDWQIEGISGIGRLSGVIPVRIRRKGLAVVGGQLDSAGAGAIRVDWGAARETMVNSGEQVALAVNALEDFQYDSLSIGVDQPEDGALTLAIGLEGANPAVLDGYPFRFNINLSGELAPILEAVREGRRVGAELLQGGLGSP